jgi:tetratricopeptide (TPR) repeat protein
LVGIEGGVVSGVINLESSDVEASDWRLNPNYAKAFVNRAETYRKKNEYDRAARDYDEAIRLEPNLKAAWNGRCWTRAILGELQAALEDCNKALQSEPNDATTYDSRGLTYMKMGQFDSAIDDYNSALRFERSWRARSMDAGLPSSRRAIKLGVMPISQRQRQSRRRLAMTLSALACSEKSAI